MGIFIDGMKMPTRCFECPCLDTTDGLYCGFADKSLRKEHAINLRRPDWCPLVDVSISVDELNKIVEYMSTPNDTIKEYGVIYDAIKKGEFTEEA